jgi:hypothetical protein
MLPDEEDVDPDEPLYTGEQVEEILKKSTPGIRVCASCGYLCYLRKDACANHDCALFYGRKSDHSWTTQKGHKVFFKG